MQGYSPKLPLVKDASRGIYSMNATVLETVEQNLKMLLLTNPGERIMLPDYGVGMRRFIFDQNTGEVKSSMKTAIRTQVNRYMSFVTIEDIIIEDIQENENAINVIIQYSIKSLNGTRELNLSFESN